MADDKFIMFGLDDERSKDLADVLGNKTCKKIIDYLADIKEASEKDIADALNIPINTVEYNLNKLIKSGLIEKTKNFFWSTKGRKIDMYKLAKKHIIISPKSKPNLDKLKTILPFILAIAALVVLLGFFILPRDVSNPINNSPNTNIYNNLKQFNSLDELSLYLNSSSSQQYGAYSDRANSPSPMSGLGGVFKSAVATESSGGVTATSYSHTNIQVEGVDEADIVKNDGKYIYTLTGNKIVIVNANPAIDINIASEINVNNARNIFINDNKLIVFSESYSYNNYAPESITRGKVMSSEVMCYGCGGNSEAMTNLYIYDIKDRSKPRLESNISLNGNYVDTRMIGDYIYVISSKPVYRDHPVLPFYETNGIKKTVPINDVYYFDYMDDNYAFTTISSINLDDETVNSKVYLTGSTAEVYASLDNIYLTYNKRMNMNDYYDRQIKEVYLKIVPDELNTKINDILETNNDIYTKQGKISKIIYDYSYSLKGLDKESFDKKLQDLLNNFEEDIAKENEKTVVHKISVIKDKISYEGMGNVPGHILNQFSMDEYDGNFRIATTTGEVWNGNSLNHIYVLDKELKIIGKIENIAKGEKIYSVRFIGKRAYLVTFKKVDPFFVIDLSKPENPKILGYLKIPGYSDYLHPYDENHVIGIGKEAIDASEVETLGRNLDFAWYQGVKIALFDVTDVNNPIEDAKFVIGERGTDSPALYDHKAILFDKEKKILALPISLAEINRAKYGTNELPPTAYGEQVWQGLYVLNIDEKGISLRGRITHNDEYIGEKYGPAINEPIGSIRVDRNGNNWKKYSISYNQGQWNTDAKGFEGSIYYDYNIDEFPGGINYRPYYDYSSQIQRSLFMDDVLYTVSQSKVKANDINTINEISKIDLGYKENIYSGGAIY